MDTVCWNSYCIYTLQNNVHDICLDVKDWNNNTFMESIVLNVSLLRIIVVRCARAYTVFDGWMMHINAF